MAEYQVTCVTRSDDGSITHLGGACGVTSKAIVLDRMDAGHTFFTRVDGRRTNIALNASRCLQTYTPRLAWTGDLLRLPSCAGLAAT